MSDPFLPGPDADRGEDAAEELADAEHEGADVEEDVLPGPADPDEEGGATARPAASRPPRAGERLTADELEADLDGTPDGS